MNVPNEGPGLLYGKHPLQSFANSHVCFSVYTDGMISGNLDLPLDFTMTQFESGRVFDSQPLKKAGKRRCWRIHPSASVGMISKQSIHSY